LNLTENNQKIDLNKEILEPLRQYSESGHNVEDITQSSQHQQQQQQSSANKNVDKQRNKPITTDEPKRKVGVTQQANQNAPYDYYTSSRRSPQYAPTTQYDHEIEVYPPIPSPPTGHDPLMYSPNYQYENELPYSQNINYSQVGPPPPQPQSSYYSRDGVAVNSEHDAMLPHNEYYYYQQQQHQHQHQQHQQSPTSYGFTGYLQYPGRNYGYQQTNANNRNRYQNRRQEQGTYHGGQRSQGNQRYYDNNNALRQGPSSGVGRNRNNETIPNTNQAPGTGAYLDRRLRGDDLNVSTADFDFGSSKIVSEKPKDEKKTDEKEQKSTETTATSAENKKGVITNANDTAKNVHTEKTENEKNQKNESKDEKSKEIGSTSHDERNTTDNKTQEKPNTKPAYDKNKSFFDSITTDADKKKQQVKIEEQRHQDAETFGSVAETYRSRHQLNQEINNYRRNNNAGNQRNFNQQRRTNYVNYNQQQGFNNNYNQQQGFNNNYNQQPGFNNNYRPRYNNQQYYFGNDNNHRRNNNDNTNLNNIKINN
jgi:hypothetical protein